jgi:RNA polymerase subunit RPABC4/transcription elongation factor Spt4
MFKNVCVYCENQYPESVMVCPECNDYKGLMPMREAIIYLDLDVEDFM